jgi:hypothetical protein
MSDAEIILLFSHRRAGISRGTLEKASGSGEEALKFLDICPAKGYDREKHSRRAGWDSDTME